MGDDLLLRVSRRAASELKGAEQADRGITAARVWLGVLVAPLILPLVAVLYELSRDPTYFSAAGVLDIRRFNLLVGTYAPVILLVSYLLFAAGLGVCVVLLRRSRPYTVRSVAMVCSFGILLFWAPPILIALLGNLQRGLGALGPATVCLIAGIAEAALFCRLARVPWDKAGD